MGVFKLPIPRLQEKGFFWFSRKLKAFITFDGSTFENQDPSQNFSLAKTNSKKWSKCLNEVRIDL